MVGSFYLSLYIYIHLTIYVYLVYLSSPLSVCSLLPESKVSIIISIYTLCHCMYHKTKCHIHVVSRPIGLTLQLLFWVVSSIRVHLFRRFLIATEYPLCQKMAFHLFRVQAMREFS